MKRFLVLICLWLTILPNAYADSRLTISYIMEISEVVQNADQDTLVVFDVDNVISAPSDLIGRPKARPVRRAVFKEYEQKYGKDRVVHIHSLYYLRASEEFVEKEIKEIILGLYARKIPSIALTAMGTGKFGNIDDPMHLRVSRLKEKGIVFAFENLNKRILWDDEAGFESGVIFSGKQSKGYENTLQVYSSAELQDLLKENGFVVLAQTDINGEAFSKENSERILTIAKKV